MDNIYLNYPDNACSYIAMENMLKKPIADMEWLQHIRDNGCTKGRYFIDVIIPRYNCLSLTSCGVLTHQNQLYSYIISEHGRIWMNQSDLVMVSYKNNLDSIVPYHAVAIPYYAVQAVYSVSRITLLRDSIHYLDSSDECLQEYSTWKVESDREGS